MSTHCPSFRSTRLLTGRTHIMSLCCFPSRDGPFFFFGSSMPSPLRRTVQHVSCVRLAQDVHFLQIEPSRLCVAFLVPECIMVQRSDSCVFFYLTEAATLTIGFFRPYVEQLFEHGLSVFAAASQLRSIVPSSKSEDTATTLTRNDGTQNELTNNAAIPKRGPPMPPRDSQRCRRACERSRDAALAER